MSSDVIYLHMSPYIPLKVLYLPSLYTYPSISLFTYLLSSISLSMNYVGTVIGGFMTYFLSLSSST